MTVHRLLEYYYDEEARHMAFGRNQDNPLDYGAVIIDEASMMDLMLMGALCRALRDDCRLILTGVQISCLRWEPGMSLRTS